MTDPLEFAQLALLGEAADHLEDVAVFVWDEDRNYVAANQVACRLVGKTRDEVLQLRVGELMGSDPSELIERVQKRGVHSGTMESPTGPIEYVTCRTRVAGLPYMVSVCWACTS